MCHVFFVHSSVDGRLGLFPCLGSCEHCCWEHRIDIYLFELVLSGYMPRNEVAGSYGNSTLDF